MLITIIADASYCNETGAAGYGAWIACERGKQGINGEMRKPMTNSIAAEMMALVKGVQYGLNCGYIYAGDSLLLQSDCYGALDAFKDNRINITEEEKQIASYLIRLTEFMNLTVAYRHVKGHTNLPGNRFAANRICDQHARRNMSKMRDKIRAQRISQLLDE